MAYERLETLKKSEKSAVYLVFDSQTRRMLVEKHLRGEQSVYARLLELPHQYLPKLYEVRAGDGETVVVEEYIAGQSVASAHASEKQLEQWFLELCAVLRFLHRRNIIHRDIKPSNLLIGNDGHIRLIDFDAARVEKPEADSDTLLLGTRGYAPPEQYGFAQTDARADIYTLGVTFVELLGDKAKTRRWRGILKRCTALEPKRRYQHVWRIPAAIYFARFRRMALYPAVALLLLLAFGVGLSVYRDENARTAAEIVFSSRRSLVFEDVDIRAAKKSDSHLAAYSGNISEPYARLANAYPGVTFISTGYADENGRPLFGAFSATYSIDTGERYYNAFLGLYTDAPRHILPEDCGAYAPAVLQLYQLNVFDTPLF